MTSRRRLGPIAVSVGILMLIGCGSGSSPPGAGGGGQVADAGNGSSGGSSGGSSSGGAGGSSTGGALDASGSMGTDASSPSGDAAPSTRLDGSPDGGPAGTIQHVFVIAMENHDSTEIYGDTTDAPYINNTLLPMGAHATNFDDELAQAIPSEPHYVWMEAATNAFTDVTFTSDSDPSASNTTSSTAHLATQIAAAGGPTWRTYQEGLDATTGACPIHSNAFYAAKHDPFVFFQDLVGSTPSATSTSCVTHHRAYSAFVGDLAAGDVASYTFITPNLCNDMHGAIGCPDSNLIKSGDDWLATELPRIIAYANAHAGVVLLVWDEGDNTGKMPFVALGPTVKTGYVGTVAYTHSSIVKSVEEILGLAILPKASTASDLSDLFTTFP